MKNESPQDLIDDLDDLLDQERKALVTGDLDKIRRLLSHKEILIDKINTLDAFEQASLAAINAKVTRNQVLLNSAMEGIRAVANRMADLRKVRRGLETYDQKGRKTRFGTHTDSSVEKRA